MAQRDLSLLDRLHGAGVTAGGFGAFDRYTAYESVRRNLERICGARRGMAAAQIDYGLPEIDFSYGRERAIDQLRLAILENVQRYEPRLADVSVLPAETSDARVPTVLIEARHVADPSGHYGAFLVLYHSPGAIEVALA